jgi:lipopolysaccharide export system protein LptA
LRYNERAEKDPMGKTKLQLRHTLRLFSGAVLVVVLVALTVSFLTRNKRQIQVPEIAAELEDQKIDKKEGLEVRGIKGDKEVTNITADRHFIGEDNLYHMEGNVRISLANRIDGEDVILRGENVIHDSEWTYFWLKGQATVEFKDLVVQSSVLEYDAQNRVFKSDQAVQFSSETISGSAQMCDYFIWQKKAELRGEVHLSLLPSQGTSVPIEIETGYFEYFIGKGRGKAEGGVLLTHGKSQASADLLEIVLSASREQIKSLFLKDGVKINLVDEFRRDEPISDDKALALHGDRCQIEADEILIKGYVDMPQIKRLEATGGGTFRFVSEDGSYTQFGGREIAFDLTDQGDLKMLIVNKDARISEFNQEKGTARNIEGQIFHIQGNKKLLLVEGSDASNARIWSKDSEITAQEIWLFLESNNMEAKNGTKVILYPRENNQDTFGFFSKENPIFITATDLRYSEEDKRFHFSGGTKIWQMNETIKAQEMSLKTDTGAVLARGDVESVLPYRPKEEDEEVNVWIKSSEMEYFPDLNEVVYTEKVNFKARDIVLTAKLLKISLEEESSDMLNIVVHDKVVVVQKSYEGRGDEARFDVKEEIITVVGNPVFIDKDKGRTEGGKLTFHMADGRIVVENKDRERSITVIKF